MNVKWIVALAGFLALGIAGIHFDVLASLPGGLGARSVESTLRDNAVEKLRAANTDWAQLKISGQQAVLSGNAANEAARDETIKLIRESTGSGGLILGGITRVNATLVTLNPVIESHFWQAEKTQNGAWTLSGYVGTEAARQMGLASISNATSIADTLHIETGIGTAWDGQTQSLLAALERLDEGVARLEDNTQSLNGRTTDANIKAELEAQFAQLPPPLLGKIALVLDEPNTADPNTAVTEGAPIAEAAQCQQLFSVALRDNTILFSTSSADINPQSLALLDSIASIALRCSAFSLTISGHTDQLGDPAFNDQLSEWRAQAVQNYFIDKGMPASQMQSHGAGSREPICGENTRACRQQNRRIEIAVE